MRLFFTTIVLIIHLGLFAQKAEVLIKGSVSDKETGEPLPGVHVIYGENLGVLTNSEGEFQFNAHPGFTKVTFKYIGYLTLVTALNADENDSPYFKILLSQLNKELNEIVVSASKSEQRISDITVSMNVIKPASITDNHIVNAEEIADQTTGVEVSDGQASMRGGSGYSYGAGSRVLALIDGLPVLSDDASNIRWQFLPLENLSQIEIIKGASSVLYGSSALNGVINFRTAEAGNKPILKFSAMTGIFDEPKQKNWVWWNSPRMYSNISFSHLKKYGNNTSFGISSNLLIDNGYRKLNDEKLGRISLNIKRFSPKFENLNYGINFNLGYNQKQDFILWENADSGALKQSESTAIELNGLFFTLSPFITMKKADKSHHDLKLQLQSSQNKYPDNPPNNSNAVSYFIEYQAFQKITKQFGVSIGASGRFSKITSQFYGDHNGNNIAGYSQLDFSPIEKLKIIGGIRLEYNSLDGIEDNLVPIFRTGINYQVANYSFLRASFGQGYRYPSIAEKHAYTALGAVKIIPNPEIEPESGWSSELGFMQGIKIGDFSGKADISVFYSKGENMIEYIFGLYPDPFTQEIDFGFKATNVENSRVYGIETELLLNKQIGKSKVTFAGGYTYMYPMEIDKTSGKETGIFLKYRRKHSAMTYLVLNSGKLEIGFRTIYKSKILNIDNVFLDPLTRESILPGFYDYWTQNNSWNLVLNGHIACQFNNNLKLSFQVKNLTNEEYMGRPGDIAPQRFYSLQLSGSF
jgi:outer membrane receptor protein involved in Fe transport